MRGSSFCFLVFSPSRNYPLIFHPNHIVHRKYKICKILIQDILYEEIFNKELLVENVLSSGVAIHYFPSQMCKNNRILNLQVNNMI